MVATHRQARVQALEYVSKLSEEEWARRQDSAYIEDYIPADPNQADPHCVA
jgi:hypothetical protein